MTTSIMLCTYNRLDLTKQTLESLFETTKSKYRLIIIDNYSTDNTKDYLSNLKPLSKYCINYDVYFNNSNLGISIGRNQGLKLSNKYQDKYLATIDNDVILPVNWLQKCIDIIASNPTFSIGVNMENVKYPLITSNNKTFQYKNKGNLGTAAMVFPRTLHTKLGYFRDYNLKYSCEDSNWGFRSLQVGYKLGYLEEMGIHIGADEEEKSEYREFKTECHKKALIPFQKDCYDYMAGKSTFIDFDYNFDSSNFLA